MHRNKDSSLELFLILLVNIKHISQVECKVESIGLVFNNSCFIEPNFLGIQVLVGLHERVFDPISWLCFLYWMVSWEDWWVVQVASEALQIADAQLEGAFGEIFLSQFFFLYLDYRLRFGDLLFWRLWLFSPFFGVLFGVFLFLLRLLLDFLLWRWHLFGRLRLYVLFSIKDLELNIFSDIFVVYFEQADRIIACSEYLEVFEAFKFLDKFPDISNGIGSHI